MINPELQYQTKQKVHLFITSAEYWILRNLLTEYITSGFIFHNTIIHPAILNILRSSMI